MYLTNPHALPRYLYEIILAQQKKPAEHEVHVTDLTRPPLIRRLLIDHWEHIRTDAASELWALLGTAIHDYIVERADAKLKHYNLERKLTACGQNFVLKGQLDLLLWDDRLVDVKLTSRMGYEKARERIEKGLDDPWVQQVNIYRWMLERSTDFRVSGLQIHVLMRDLFPARTFYHDYPDSLFAGIDVPMWTLEDTEDFVLTRLSEHVKPVRACTLDEMWYTTGYALMERGKKRAIKVEPTREKLVAYAEEKGIEIDGEQYYIENRDSGRRRCANYCPVAGVCPLNSILTDIDNGEEIPLQVSIAKHPYDETVEEYRERRSANVER